MVVVIILGIMAGVLLPNMDSPRGGASLDGAARNLSDLMDYAFTAAVSTGRTHGLVFKEDGSEFILVAENPDADPAAPAVDEMEGGLAPVFLPGTMSNTLPPGIRLTNAHAFETDLVEGEPGCTRILFFPDGTTEFITLELTDARGDRRTIKLNGISGTIQIGTPTGDEDGDKAAAAPAVESRD